LVLDEPTTGIDPRSRIDLWDLIQDLVETGTTVLLTTQYLDEADQLAARIGVIDQGRLIAEGTPEELKDKVGGSVVELTVADSLRDRTMGLLDAINGDSPTFEPASKRITLAAPDGARTLTAAVRALDGAGITPGDITLRKPTLDDVFLTLTGHVAEERDADSNGGPRRRRRARRAR
jgi:ABC-2 type transport system ATP-binding protein